MKVGLYAVLDNASAVYDGCVPAQNDAVALRNFTNMVKNDDSPIGRNPECYSLWRVGSWDDSKGEVEAEIKQCLGYAVDLLNANTGEN